MVAKIVKGTHNVLGVPSLSSPNLCNTALFLNAGKNFQIVAQPIKIKEGKKTSSIGSKIILIPDSYNGYFELLSEEGRSTKPFENVLELSRRRNIRVIVRESFVIRSTSNNANKTLNAGEILTPLNDDGKFLQCRTTKNQLIALPLDCKAKFSPLAKEKEDSISGVHTVFKRKKCNKILPYIHIFFSSFLSFSTILQYTMRFDDDRLGKKFTEETDATHRSFNSRYTTKRIKDIICARI